MCEMFWKLPSYSLSLELQSIIQQCSLKVAEHSFVGGQQ